MKINFSKNAWTTDEITYAYSYRFYDMTVDGPVMEQV